MTDIATRARDNATHCEAVKYALRQSKDGVVVSFVLHPAEIPEAVQLAPIGQRFVLAFVELSENEEPKPVRGSVTWAVPPTAHATQTEPAPAAATPARASRPWHEIPYPQQAGILCGSPKFRQFVEGRNSTLDPEVYVRRFCRVDSRQQIQPGTEAENRWNLLVSAYREWERAA